MMIMYWPKHHNIQIKNNALTAASEAPKFRQKISTYNNRNGGGGVDLHLFP